MIALIPTSRDERTMTTMPCNSSTAAIIQAGPSIWQGNDISFDNVSSSLTPVSCNTGSGPCGQTAPGNADIDLTISRINSGLNASLQLSIYTFKTSLGIAAYDISVLMPNIVYTFVNTGESYTNNDLKVDLDAGYALYIIVWYPISSSQVSLVAGLAYSAQACA